MPAVHPVLPHLPRPLLFGHRGASRHAPENTLESFDLASRLGADVLELDVHLSADGEVVVCHDESLERTTDGQGLLREKTASELTCLDAGFSFRTGDGGQPFRGRGLRIPLLREVLAAFPAMAFNIEIKQRTPPMVRPVLGVLAAAGIAPTAVLLTAHDAAVMETLEAACPECALGLSYDQSKRLWHSAWLGNRLCPVPASYSSRALQIPPWYKGMPVFTRRLVRHAAQHGIEVHLWTINEPARARAYLRRGASGIITDDPGAMLQVVQTFRRGHQEDPTPEAGRGGATSARPRLRGDRPQEQ